MCAFIVKKLPEGQTPSVPETAPKAPPTSPAATPAASVVSSLEPAPHAAKAPPVPPMQSEPTLTSTWEELGLSADLTELLRKEGLEAPTPVQIKSIPEVLDGIDAMVTAQTGTGKTAAFALPIIERVRGRNGTYALVLAPTREIALQSQKVFEQLGKPFGVDAISLIGGTDLKTDEQLLRNYPQVIVATPGRICDHIERGTIWLEYLEVLVLDEADRMLDMGFSTQLNRILEQTPTNRQTLMFSATLATDVERLAHKILYDPIRVQVGQASKAAKTVEQHFAFLYDDEKFLELEHILFEEPGTMFIFTRSKDAAAKLWRDLRNRGYHFATQLHSDLTQEYREEALADFKKGKYRVLIATDVVGRGIHVDDVARVLNYDFPRDAEDYVHRIGRTGRAEKSGVATSFVTPRDVPTLRKVEKLLGRRIDVPEGFETRGRSSSGGRGGRSGGGGRR